MTWKPPRIWEGGDVWILGGGKSLPEQFDVPLDIIVRVFSGAQTPDAYSSYMEKIHNKHIIGINNIYQIGTWVDVLFFGDSSWHLKHRHNLAKWPGLKVSCSPKFAKRKKETGEGVKFLAKDTEHRQGITGNPSKVAWNGNSGAAAISLAAHFGVRRIFLLGFDMTADNKDTHWHGSHGGTRKPPFKRHLRGFPAIADDASRLGIEILNVNKKSAINVFSKITLDEAICYKSDAS
jgi:hypothetical protein